MQKEAWLKVISDKIQSHLSIEHSRKIQTGAALLAGFFALMTAINLMAASSDKTIMEQTKVLFLTLFHLAMVLSLYLPEWLQKGDKILPRLLGVRDFTSLIFTSITLTIAAFSLFSISRQIVAGTGGYEVRSGLVIFYGWMNVIVSGVYLAGFVSYFSSLLFFPKFLTRLLDKMGSRRSFIFLCIHSSLFFLGYFSYQSVVGIGSVLFFEELRLAGLFLIFTVTMMFLAGKILEESAIPALNALYMEVASGKLERSEDILSRVKQAFISKRLAFWISRIARNTATHSHEIAEFLHQSVSMIELDRPSEAQLAQTEDRYRKASQIYKKLEASHQRFLLNASFFSLLDIEREKVDELKDQFSKELRHAKLELSSVRKRIDDKLHDMKDRERPELRSEVPVESVTISR